MKTKNLTLIFILLIIILFNINISFATEEELIDSTSLTYENDEITVTETEETEVIEEELPSTDLLSSNGVTNVSTVNSISEMNLRLNNILNIILIAIGVLLILFAIAILIRLNTLKQ